MQRTDKIKFEKGNGIISRWDFDDVKISHANSYFSKQTSFAADSDDEVVRLHYGLQGEYSFDHEQLGRSFSGLDGRQNIMYSKGFTIQVHAKSPELETFGIQFPKELFVQYTQDTSDPLQRFCEAILEGRSCLLSSNWPLIDLASRRVIQEIRNCNYQGNMRKLFLLSKSIELLVLSAEAHNFTQHQPTKFIKNKTDKEKIIAARELVSESIQEPPHLDDLARLVGINEYKLKGGFKELFQTTVYGFIRERRLLLAYQYLLDTELSAAEIAAKLGYANPQHFSNVFKKKYGRSPSSVRKNP